MKRTAFFPILAALLILSSCSKEDRYTTGWNDQEIIPDLQVMNCTEQVFLVPPPTGGDDTPNLLNTIAVAQAAGPGSVIRLQEGTYHIGFIEIHEFFGTIKGAGREKTIIKPVPNLPCLGQVSKTMLVSLVTFVGGDIRMTDLAFTIDDGDVCAEDYLSYGKDLYILIFFTDRMNDAYIPEKITVSAHVENCDFSSGMSESGVPIVNACAALWMGFNLFFPFGTNAEMTDGNLFVNNCRFSNIWAGLDIAAMGSGKLDIRNSLFKNLAAPLFFYDNVGFDCSIINNRFIKSTEYDIYIDDSDFLPLFAGGPEKRATYRIAGNYFDTYLIGGPYIRPSGVSMYLLDIRTTMYPAEGLPMKFYIENNRFNLHEGTTGIVGINNKNALMLANKITGNGITGISLNGEGGGYSADNKILGNYFMTSDLSEADIMLGELTRNCIVTGGNDVKIINLGTDNKITGVMKKPGMHPWAFNHISPIRSIGIPGE
jgi:hypothetical protein